MSRAGVVVVTSGFPRISETFALNELLALRSQGLLAAIFATKPGDGRALQPGAEALLPLVDVLPPGDAGGQASELLARLEGRPVAGFHGYFAHRPAAVAAAAAARTGRPYGFSVHALDARKVPPAELAARSRTASGVVACNDDVAATVQAAGGRLRLIPHGVDLARFYPSPPPAGPVLRLLAVGRLVEKKGLPVLLAAVGRLRAPVTLQIVGTGPEHPRLAAAGDAAGLADRVELVGAVTHEELPAYYRRADVVVVPSVVDGNGDRDGRPNVVLEAMASGRPVVASDLAAIGTAVAHRRTGLLVPPDDPEALAGALDELAAAPRLRAELGLAARARVETDFDLGRCAQRFGRALAEIYG